MDRSLYILYTVLLDKCILAQNRRSFYIFLHILYTKHDYAYQVFGAVAGEKLVFYANINTKCFFSTSNILFYVYFVWFLNF